VPFTPVTGARALVAPDEDLREMVRLLASAALGFARKIEASSVHVLFPSTEEAALWEACGFMPRAGFQYHWFRDGAATFEDYVCRFKSKRRNQVRREASQAAKDGLRIETIDASRITPPDVADMYRFYTSTVDKHFYGNRYLNRRFFDLVAERFTDRLAWVFARDASGAALAGAFNVQKGKRLYGRYWGADVDRPFLHFDVCYYHGVRECLARGLDVFEPGAGGEHKRARGFVPTMTHSLHHVFDARLRSILEPHVARERERVTQIVEGGTE
jgi:predicted N-acyltransferase